MIVPAQLATQQAPTSDSVVAVAAEAMALRFVPPEERPFFGTFWGVRASFPCIAAPSPCPPLDPSTPVYAITDHQFLVDQTEGQPLAPTSAYAQRKFAGMDQASIQEAWLKEIEVFIMEVQERQAAADLRRAAGMDDLDEHASGPLLGPLKYTADDLWLEITTLTNSVAFFIIHPPTAEVTNGVYDLYMTTNLSPSVAGLNLTNWMWLLRSDPGETNLLAPELTADQAFFMLGRTDDTDGDSLSDAYEHLVSHTDPNVQDYPVVTFQPLSQTVEEGDTVTFAVVSQGPAPLRYQWLFGESEIPGETNRALSILAIQQAHAGDYAVRVSSPGGLSVLSSNATLTVQEGWDVPLVTVLGARQNYTFKKGFTYYIPSRAELYGETVIEGGTVIKMDRWYSDSTLVILGTLVCKTDDPYFPAFLTSAHDYSLGEYLYSAQSEPLTAQNGAAYLDLTMAQNARPALDNLRIRYADSGIITPEGTTIDVWNCQFLKCNAGIIATKDSTVSLHNSLFGSCGSAVVGSTNFTAIEAEHMTADVTNLWTAGPPSRISLTNSIVVGQVGTGPTPVTDHCAINPAGPLFQRNGTGHYYLANGSPYRATGTTNISSRLAKEFRRKTTQPPVSLPAFMDVTGEMTLGPQVARYTNGAPDYGAYYAALDYTVARLRNQGAIKCLPGTALGIREEYSPERQSWSLIGFDLREDSSFISSGLPDRPNVFVDVQFVQERFAPACAAIFVPEFWPSDPNSAAPSLDLRFSRLYPNGSWFHLWAGYDAKEGYLQTPCSLVDWSMRDCSLNGGRITLGEPDDGSWYGIPQDWEYGAAEVSWLNNLFDNVSIDINPTYYKSNSVVNCDLSFDARNNLFIRGLWFHLQPIPASAGDWVFKDNLFDKVNLIQNTNAPLDFGHNAYWPLTTAELDWYWCYHPWYEVNDNRLLVTTNGGGGNELLLSHMLPYQTGPLGNHYLPLTTPLYHVGSSTPANAGLFHHTPRVAQVKAGAEPGAHDISIGLHYVATANAISVLGKDSDGDGIPDYVEDANGNGAVDGDETDTALVSTDGIRPDANSEVYTTTDLDGDGLDGFSEQVLATSPLVPDNPFDLSTTALITPLSGVVHFPLNLSSNLDSTAPILLNVNGFSGNTAVYKTNGSWIAEWDTMQFPNGVHRLSCEFQSGETSVAVGVTKLFVIQNDICFPDGLPLAGDTLFIQPQTIDISGTWALQIYDDQENLFTSLSGQVDSDGYCLDPNTSNRGIAISLLDTNGNPLPSISYTAVVTTSSATDGPSSSVTNKISIDGPWTGNRMWAIASQPLSQFGTVVNTEIKGMMDLMAVIVQETFGQELMYDVDFTVSGPSTWRLTTNQKWGQLAYRLGVFTNATDARNFFYFGHFDGKNLGGTTNPAYSISITDIRNGLGNAPYPLKGPNKHPFRFVFIDGCNSASGDLCTAFGIPRKQLTSQQMRDKGLEPRAFVGWKTVKLVGLGGAFNYGHLEFVRRFWELWPMTNSATGRPYTLQEALDQAHREKAPPFFSKPTIYGCPDLPYR